MILTMIFWAFIILLCTLFVAVLVGGSIGLFCGLMGIGSDGIEKGSMAHKLQGSDDNLVEKKV